MPKSWDVLGSRITYKDRWLTLRTDRCRTESGHILENFHILEYPDWINVLPITPSLDVVLVQEYRHGAGRVVLGLPSGTIDKSGEAPIECARRELTEETAYQGGSFYHLGTTSPNPATQNNLVHSFLAVNVEPTGRINLDASESIEILKMPFSELLRRALEQQLDFQAPHIAALHWAMMFLVRSKQPELKELRTLTLSELQR